MISNFIDRLFRPGEKTCLSRDAFGTSIFDVENWEFVTLNAQYFVINPLRGTPNEQGQMRADDCVTAYRNILVEIDKLPLDEQQPFVKSKGMPYSTKVYSGNKSYHYVISLDRDVSLLDYKGYVQRVYDVMGRKNIDPANSNPARFSRNPLGIHSKTANEQLLLEVRDAVSTTELSDWLDKHGAVVRLTVREQVESVPEFVRQIMQGQLSKWTQYYLRFGAPEGQRHRQLYLAAVDFSRCGYPHEEAENQLLAVWLRDVDCHETEGIRTIRDAYRRVGSI